MRQTKTKYYKSQFEACKSNARKVWHNINSIIGKSSKVSKFDANSNSLNKFFTRIGNFDKDKIHAEHVTNDNPNVINNVRESLFLSPTISNEIIILTHSLNKNAATGYDLIPMKAVLFTINEIATVLSDMCNLSFQSGIFPQLMKTARITSIFKSGDTDNLPNYRPIFILPIF